MLNKLLPGIEHLPQAGGCLPDKLWPFIWYFVKQIKLALLLILFLNITMSCLYTLTPRYVKVFIDAFDAESNPDEIWDRLAWPFTEFVLLVLFAASSAQLISTWLRAKVFPAFVDMMRRQMALYMHGHCYSYFQDDFSGRLAGKVIEMPSAIMEMLDIVLMPFLFMTVSFLVYPVVLSQAHPSYMIVIGFWMVFYLALLRYLVPRIIRDSSAAYEARNIVRGRFVDTLSNILQVKLFARAKFEDSYLVDSLKGSTRGFERLYHKFFYLYMGLNFLSFFLWAGLLFLTILLWRNGEITPGDAAMVMPVAISLTSSTWWVSEMAVVFFEKIGEVHEGMSTITASHEVTDLPGAPGLEVVTGMISFRQVRFSYGNQHVFEGLDIDIPAGQKVGLVGPSGAGKSSFVQILLRLYDIQQGEILIDNQNIAMVRQESLRENIAIIPQNSDLLHRSIYENIRYGRLGATKDEVISAAKHAHAHEFIVGLEDNEGNRGYDAKVGERGVRLSGGQRQRIAIARAILKNAPILILDEATSALDSESEKLIQESLGELMRGRTVVAIAHRLSTIAHLDRLVVMDEGRIIEDGSHLELLLKGGLYSRLWHMQSGGFIL